MKLFQIRGGVHPDDNKASSASQAIEPLPLAKYLYIPLQQHVGAPADPRVEVGQRVLKGELLAYSQGAISAPVHAPSSGVIVDICDHTAPHPSGLPVSTIVLETDGLDQTLPALTQEEVNPFLLSGEEIALRVGAAGIVGMGGATFPSAVKLNPKANIKTLIINGGECEPYLTADDRLMREHAEQIVDGVRIMLHGLRSIDAMIAIEDNKPEALKAIREAAKPHRFVQAISIPSRYPMGSEKHMIQTLTGKEVPAGKRPADLGLVVHNVGTAYAVHRALRFNEPLTSRIVTVSGGAALKPKNLRVAIGTPIQALLDHCGVVSSSCERILMGGPMMGQAMPSTDVPVVKGSNGIIALDKSEITIQEPMPCIRCGSCVSACPCGLMPLEMAARAKQNDLDGTLEFGLMDCISCGSCSYVCPSNIPLVQYFNYAKGLHAHALADAKKADQTRELAAARNQRLERLAREKKEKMARQKAERERKKAEEAAKKATQEAEQQKAEV